KTTLLRSITGRVRLDSGALSLLGEPLETAARGGAARQRLGVVPQDIALYGELNARENLALFGALHGVAGRRALRERVDWALAWTGLAERARERVKGFSGGMKRRLNIACGVLHQPEVILLDEPTVGVDPQSRARIWEMLEGLRERGASLLITTHQLDEAQQICDRIVIIDHGVAIASGTLDELIAATVGSERAVILTLEAAPEAPLELAGAALDGRVIQARHRDIARELPPLLERVQAAGLRVADVKVEAPSLQAVFLHLTGRELRE
ncbi:MAG: ABC transporter ATP-binding protein, partial [Myxococcales bacterium]|nr:ABC transporter ATP-binding protein [Myxococcales bacterium]